jgi:hypothetical protein
LGINQVSLFMNPAAVDLPFDDYTLLGWSEFGSSNGEAILLDGNNVATRHDVAGLFTAVGLSDSTGAGRLVHHSLTGLDDATGSPSVGLYATDFTNGTPSSASIQLLAEGDAGGAVAVDQDGTVLATFVDLAGDMQSARGFAASTIAPGATTTSGDVLFTIPGSGTAIAASAPSGNAPGLLFLQTFDSTSFMSEDVLVQAYSVAGDTVSAVGTPVTALSMTVPGTPANLMRDDLGRIWLAVDSDVAESTYFVLERL